MVNGAIGILVVTFALRFTGRRKSGDDLEQSEEFDDLTESDDLGGSSRG
jgi:hypothetical protein